MRSLLALLGMIVLVPFSFSDTVPQVSESVTVTATRDKTETKNIAREVKILDRKQIDATGATSVIDVLQTVPGLLINTSGGYGSPASVYIRGAKPGQALIMVDGMELNDPMTPDRSVDMSALPLDAVQRIEVVFGPASATYGSDAVAGVINIITTGGGDGITVRSEVGSHATWTTAITLRHTIARGSYWLNGSLFRTDGISAADSADGNTEADGFSNHAISGGVTLNFDQSTVTLTGFFINADGDLDNSGGPGGDNPFYRFDRTEKHIKGSWSLLNPLGLTGESQLTVSYGENERNYNNPSEDFPPTVDSRYRGVLQRINWHNRLLLNGDNTLSFGLETTREEGESAYHSMSAWGPYDDIFDKQHVVTDSAYVSDRGELLGLGFNVGVRYDDNQASGAKITGSFGMTKELSDSGFRLRAYWGTSFKAPTLYQLYSPYGTTELGPESGTSYELGVDRTLMNGRMLMSLTWFQNNFTDMIDFDPNTYTYFNIAEATVKGAEIGFSFTGDTLSWHIFYDHYITHDGSTGERLLRRPEAAISAALDYKHDRFTAHAGVVYNGPRDDMDYAAWPAVRISLNSYALVNLKLDYALTHTITVYLKGLNIIDEKYQLVSGYGTLGSTWYSGVVFRFRR